MRARDSACDQDPQPQVCVVYDEAGTVASLRNELAGMASAEWLCFLDADDELEPGFIAAMTRAASRLPDDGRFLLTPAVSYTAGDGRSTRPRVWLRRNLRDGNYLVIGTLIQRDFFLEVGGFREWPMYEDWCLWQRCHRAGARVVEVRDAVYLAHASVNSRNRAPSQEARLEAHHMIRRANYPELYGEEA